MLIFLPQERRRNIFWGALRIKRHRCSSFYPKNGAETFVLALRIKRRRCSSFNPKNGAETFILALRIKRRRFHTIGLFLVGADAHLFTPRTAPKTFGPWPSNQMAALGLCSRLRWRAFFLHQERRRNQIFNKVVLLPVKRRRLQFLPGAGDIYTFANELFFNTKNGAEIKFSTK